MSIMSEESLFLEFIGRFDHVIDEKGRLSIPAVFRKSLISQGDGHVVITVGLDGCLDVFPLQRFRETQKKLLELQRTAKVRRYIRAFNALATRAQLDSHGRIAIGRHLLDGVGIKDRVTITGNMDRVELWNPETYESYMEDIEQLLEEGIDGLDI